MLKIWKSVIKDTSLITDKLDEIYQTIKEQAIPDSLSLMGGSSGIALFQFYYGSYTKNEEAREEGIKHLESAFESINNGFAYSKYAGGLAGFAWCVNHLVNEDLTDLDGDLGLALLTPYMRDIMIKDMQNGYYDYLHGALGIALYLTLNDNSLDKNNSLTQVLDILIKNGKQEQNVIKWKSQLIKDKGLYGYNLSLSHGMSSIIAVLLKFAEKNIARKESIELIDKSINFILSNARFNNDALSVFSDWINNEEPKYKSRLGWCYGDLGIGITLWRAGDILKRNDIKDFAEKVLLKSIKRKDLKENSVADAGLCHGSAGIAHIYNRMYNYTDRIEFKDAAIYWFEQTMQMAKFDDGLAGFKVWRSPEMGGLQNQYGFLEGIAGIGLALISAISDTDPKWDECLLLS